MRKPIIVFAVAVLLASQLTGCVSPQQVDNLNSELISIHAALSELQATQSHALLLQEVLIQQTRTSQAQKSSAPQTDASSACALPCLDPSK
jgi:outer membrane murein-binding lipoprotein Lpp